MSLRRYVTNALDGRPIGNMRIVSAAIGYHTDEIIDLKDMPNPP